MAKVDLDAELNELLGLSTVTKVATANLTGHALDWVLAKCEGVDFQIIDGVVRTAGPLTGEYRFRRNAVHWLITGPLIEKARITLGPSPDKGWVARSFGDATEWSGETPQLAFLRCYIADRLGAEVDVPDELLK